MKTIRLSDDEYNRLLDMLEFIPDVRTCVPEHFPVYVERANELASTIVCNTTQYDYDEDDDANEGLRDIDDSQENDRWERI